MTLHELGLKYGTDKATFHNFCETYDKYMNSYRDKEFNFLEIGILNGSSLLMWNEYFQKANIIGADIMDKKNFDGGRIKTYIVNQEIPSQLLSIPGEFDIIVEDGGHSMLQQQVTLNVMIDKVKSGGIFVLEDLHTSCPQFLGYQHFGGDDGNNTIRLLNDLKNGKMSSNDYYISESDFNTLLSKIKSIEIFELEPSNIGSQGCKSMTSIIIKK